LKVIRWVKKIKAGVKGEDTSKVSISIEDLQGLQGRVSEWRSHASELKTGAKHINTARAIIKDLDTSGLDAREKKMMANRKLLKEEEMSQFIKRSRWKKTKAASSASKASGSGPVSFGNILAELRREPQSFDIIIDDDTKTIHRRKQERRPSLTHITAFEFNSKDIGLQLATVFTNADGQLSFTPDTESLTEKKVPDVVVQDILPDCSASNGNGEVIKRGSIVVTVAGENVLGIGMKATVAKINDAPRPVTIHLGTYC